MSWEIENITYNQSYSKGIRLITNFPFDCFFDVFKLHDWHRVIDMAIQEGGFQLEGVVGIIYFKTLDWHDINIAGIIFPEDSVMARFVLESPAIEATMKKVDFEMMLLEFSKKLLKLHQNNDTLPENWVNTMEDRLKLLEDKLQNYA